MLAGETSALHSVAMRSLQTRFFSLIVVLIFGVVGLNGSGRASDDSPWVQPPAVSIRKLSGATGAQNQPYFMSNLDCTLLSYRLVSDSTMQNGCFSSAAFGLVDTDSGRVIFNGTDEAVNIVSYTGRQVLVPWPNALNLLAADTAASGGSYLSMYKNPLASFEDQRNYIGQLTGKRLKNPPELPLIDSQGNKLLVNLQTTAFSDGGSWMAAETMTGAFVRINLATLNQMAFAPAFAQSGSPATMKSVVSIKDDGREVAIANDIDSSFKIYGLSGCSPGQKYDVCTNYNYWPALKLKLPGLYSIRSVRFINDRLIKFEAWSTNSTEVGTYLLSPSAQIDSLTDYLALGDSYTSGEGAYNYRSGTDTAENRCHASVHAYPELLTRELFSNGGGNSVACAGAVINDVGNQSPKYRGQVRGVAGLDELKSQQTALLTSVLLNHTPGYIAQHHFVKQDQPRVVSVSIGGNDVGFGNIVVNCVAPKLSIHASDNTCFNTYEDRLELLQHIDRTVPRWTALFKQLGRESPLSKLYAIGYPDIISDQGSCGLNVQLNQSEREFARELLVYINASIRKAAGNAGVTYVDIEHALNGHRLCENARQNLAVNGVTAGTDSGVLGTKVIGSESYHPNALGHLLIAQAIRQKTANLTSNPASGEGSAPSGLSLLDKPKSNRPIRVRLPAALTEKQVVQRGSKISVAVDGLGLGLRPNTSYAVQIGSITGTIENIVSDNTGSLVSDIIVPQTATSGGTTLEVVGSNQNGESIVITQPIFVADDPADTDADGTPDSTDACIAIPDSGVDEDGDGIDDACDSSITEPGNQIHNPTPGTPAASTTNPPTPTPPSSVPTSLSTTVAGLDIALGSPQIDTRSIPINTPAGINQPAGRVPAVRQYPLQSNTATARLISAKSSSSPPHRLPLKYYSWMVWLGLCVVAWWIICLCVLAAKWLWRMHQSKHQQLQFSV
jgi:hypothetical protein